MHGGKVVYPWSQMEATGHIPLTGDTSPLPSMQDAASQLHRHYQMGIHDIPAMGYLTICSNAWDPGGGKQPQSPWDTIGSFKSPWYPLPHLSYPLLVCHVSDLYHLCTALGLAEQLYFLKDWEGKQGSDCQCCREYWSWPAAAARSWRGRWFLLVFLGLCEE